jgi:hypothetical protein
MNTTFNFYDFISYIIPGAVVLGLLYWFVVSFLAVSQNIGGGVPENILLFIFIAASYFLGHMLKAIGGNFEEIYQKSGNWPSRFFDFRGSPYTEEYKKKLKDILQETFELRPPNDTEVWQQQNEIFHLCHALIRQEHMEANTDTLEAICNLFRSLYIAGWASAIICTLVFLKQLLWLIVLLISGSTLSSNAFFKFNLSQLLLGAFLSLLFFSSISWLRPRWKRYVQYYISSVYTNVFVWYQNKKKDEQVKEKKGSASAR